MGKGHNGKARPFLVIPGDHASSGTVSVQNAVVTLYLYIRGRNYQLDFGRWVPGDGGATFDGATATLTPVDGADRVGFRFGLSDFGATYHKIAGRTPEPLPPDHPLRAHGDRVFNVMFDASGVTLLSAIIGGALYTVAFGLIVPGQATRKSMVVLTPATPPGEAPVQATFPLSEFEDIYRAQTGKRIHLPPGIKA